MIIKWEKVKFKLYYDDFIFLLLILNYVQLLYKINIVYYGAICSHL